MMVSSGREELEPRWFCFGLLSMCQADSLANRRNLAMFLAMSDAHPARAAPDGRLAAGG
jgi:hypothetical protein